MAEPTLILCKIMESYLEIEEFRNSEEAVAFAEAWLKAQRSGDVTSDYHMNLLAWATSHPAQVLGIVLNLIDRVHNDDSTAEMVAIGPVEWLCGNCNDDFVPILREAIRKHAGIATFTRGNRENSTDPSWLRLRNPPPAVE